MTKTRIYSHPSSHHGHVLYAVIFFLVGVLVGYGVGQAYEAERMSGVSIDQVVSRLVKKNLASSMINSNGFTPPTGWQQYVATDLKLSFWYPPALVVHVVDATGVSLDLPSGSAEIVMSIPGSYTNFAQQKSTMIQDAKLSKAVLIDNKNGFYAKYGSTGALTEEAIIALKDASYLHLESFHSNNFETILRSIRFQ